MNDTTELTAPTVAQGPSAADIERLLRKLPLDPAAAKRSHDFYRTFAWLQSGPAAGWHNFDDIPTLAGLQGDFFWTEEWLRPARIALRFTPGREGIDGTYAISTLAGTVEEGELHCVPNNPAMGWAAIWLTPASGSNARVFTVAGMMTDAQWRISVLLLNTLDANGPVNPPFSALRLL